MVDLDYTDSGEPVWLRTTYAVDKEDPRLKHFIPTGNPIVAGQRPFLHRVNKLKSDSEMEWS